MASLNCLCPSWNKKKNNKRGKNSNTLHVKLDHLQASKEATELKSTTFKVSIPSFIPVSSRCNVKVMNLESPVAGDSGEVAYEGENERDEASPSEMDSEFNFQACLHSPNKEKRQSLKQVNSPSSLNIDDDIHNTNTRVIFDLNATGHLSDPGIEKARFWASPKLKRSCSNLAIRSPSLELENQLLSKGKSYEDMQRLAEIHTTGGSPVSIRSRCSADKVMLKKHSLSQILPSGSRKLWWKLFLWSHRNLHRPPSTKPLMSESKLHGGYSSDTIEPKHATGSRSSRSSRLRDKSVDKGKRVINDSGFYEPSSAWHQNQEKNSYIPQFMRHNNNSFAGATCQSSKECDSEECVICEREVFPQNQWLAFPPDSSPLWRVDEWVKEVSTQPPCEPDNDDDHDIAFLSSPENTPSRISCPSAKEVSHANAVIRSLNTNSTVAHISSLGLAAIPSLSLFTSLKSVNLSSNHIVEITQGSLPKGLHVLNLSRNKIATIEGLRELTHLRVLDLGYNRISRIGQGLSNCTLIKELYIAGNKISMVEGLHRLLKLTVLDLSFNKLTTAKAIGQLVANYNTLISVNLLGNPIESNLSDEILKKNVSSLLPKLVLLNKQPSNPRRARELHADANAKAALGNSSSLNSQRKAVRKGTTRGSSSHSIRRKHRSRSHSHHCSNSNEKA